MNTTRLFASRQYTLSLLAVLLPLLIITLAHPITKAEPHPAGQGYELRFKIAGLRDSMVFLANYYGEKQYLKDSAFADAAGNVIFKGKEPLPGGIYLFVFPNKTYFELLIDKEQYFSMECSSDNMIPSMKIKGSEDNIQFYAYLSFIQEQSKLVEPLRTERRTLTEQGKKTEDVDARIKEIDERVANYKKDYIAKNPERFLTAIFKASEEPKTPELPKGSKDSSMIFFYYRDHYFDLFDLSDERLLRSPVYHSKVNFFLKNLVVQYPDSVIPYADFLVQRASGNKETFKYMVWYLTNNYETSNIMGHDAVFVHLVKNYYTKDKAFWTDDATLYKIQDRARILEPILIGKKAKNLMLTDSSGKFQALYSVNAPFTILYFWDPDCGHCKKATPKVKAYYDRVRSRGVQVFAVCTEVEMDKWKKFIQEHNLDWINVADPKTQNNFRQEFDILTTPQIFILDKDKKIIAKKIDEDNMEKILDRELEMYEKKIGN